MKNTPLVSIVVITYNSAKYVQETLESINLQTFKNLELVISDDGSIDNTLKICEDWLEGNRERFIASTILSVGKNTGIPKNCNRGLNAATGDWIKLIAGDDLLLPACVEKNISFGKANNSKIIFSYYTQFTEQEGRKLFKKTKPDAKEEILFFKKNSDQQFETLLTQSFNISPASFFHRSIFEEVGLFDERYRYLEDLPFWLKITKSGITFKLMEETTVLYRIGNDSTTRYNNHFYNISFYNCIQDFRKEYIFPHVPYSNLLFWNQMGMEHLKFMILTKVFKNKKGRISNLSGSILNYFSIDYTIRSLKDKIKK